MHFFPIALILLYIDGPEIVNLKVKIILLSSKNLIGQKTPIEISGKTGPCVHKAIFFHLKSLVFIDKVIIAFFPHCTYSLYWWTWNYQFESLSNAKLEFLDFFYDSLPESQCKGPFKYYVIKEVGGWGHKMAIFDDLQYCKSSKRWVSGPKKVKDIMR